MEKLCSWCGAPFSPAKFHPRQKYCRPACSRDSWLAANREEMLRKKRTTSRIITESRKASVKRYNENHAARHIASNAAWRSKNKHKQKAHAAVAGAIKSGKLIKLPCWCGNTMSQAHHEDYSKLLEVTWLCQKHHKQEHRLYP